MKNILCLYNNESNNVLFSLNKYKKNFYEIQEIKIVLLYIINIIVLK